MGGTCVGVVVVVVLLAGRGPGREMGRSSLRRWAISWWAWVCAVRRLFSPHVSQGSVCVQWIWGWDKRWWLSQRAVGYLGEWY